MSKVGVAHVVEEEVSEYDGDGILEVVKSYSTQVTRTFVALALGAATATAAGAGTGSAPLLVLGSSVEAFATFLTAFASIPCNARSCLIFAELSAKPLPHFLQK